MGCCSEGGVYHTIVPTRSAAEIATVLGEQKVPTWVSDCYGAQLKAPAQVFQLCLAHQLRDLQRVRDTHPTEAWANLNYAYALQFAYYNFCRVHSTIRVTPAMESGITNRSGHLRTY